MSRFYVEVSPHQEGSTGYFTRKASLKVCYEIAQSACRRIGHRATILRVDDQKVMARYWRDAQGLQFIEY